MPRSNCSIAISRSVAKKKTSEYDQEIPQFKGVARSLTKLRTSKGDYWIKQWFSSVAALFKIGTSLNGTRVSEFFPLKAVPYGMENHFYHIRWSPLNVTILITHVCNCVMGATPMTITHCMPTNGIVRNSHRTLTVRRYQEVNYGKAASSLLPIKMIAELEKNTKYCLTNMRRSKKFFQRGSKFDFFLV